MKLLLAEDEKDLSAALVAVLRHSGYEVDPVYDGGAAVAAAGRAAYDAMVFDIMMPVLDGVSALKEIRAAGNLTPVILLTAKSEVEDRIEGLDAGADDYLAKPFAMGELLARLRSLTRRAGVGAAPKVTIGHVTLDLESQALIAQSSVRLASKEAQLMQYLMENAGKSVSTDEIFERVWHGEDADRAVVWLYISYLRQKLVAIHGGLSIAGEEGGSFVLQEEGA